MGKLKWLLAITSLTLLLTGCGNDNANEKVKDKPKKVEASGSETEKKEVKADVMKEESDGKVKAGTYKVGTDIPAGEYLVLSNAMAYIESAKDSTGNLDSIIFNDNLMNGAHSYVTLNDGEYFKVTDGEMYPVETAPSVIPEDGLYKDGMYKVGKDIPAGEYKVILDSEIEMGYMEVGSSSSHQLDNIVTNENIEADAYITVTDGQYLKLQGVTIQK